MNRYEIGDENASPTQRSKKLNAPLYFAEDYKSVAEKLQRQLDYREKQLHALRAALSDTDRQRQAPAVADQKYHDLLTGVSEIAGIEANSPTRALSAVKQRMHNLQEETDSATRRAKTIQDRLMEVEMLGVKSDRRSDDTLLWTQEKHNLAIKLEAAENAAARLEVELVKAKEENKSLMGQTAGLEQTRLLLKRQIEAIKADVSSMKASARERSTQTEGGLRLSREELDLRLARQNADDSRRRCEALERELHAASQERTQLAAAAEIRAAELEREINQTREEGDKKVAALKREMLRLHTSLVEGKTTALTEAESRIARLRDDLSQEYETRLAAAIKLREDEIAKSVAEQGTNFKEELDAFKLDSEKQRAALALKHLKDLQDMHAERLLLEKSVREEMVQLQSDSQRERQAAESAYNEVSMRALSLEKDLHEHSALMERNEKQWQLQLADLIKKEAAAREKLELLQNQHVKVTMQVEETCLALAEKQRDITALQEQIVSLEFLQSLPHEVKQLRNDLASVSLACQHALAERDTLRTQLETHRVALVSAEDTIENLHAHLDDTDEKSKQLHAELQRTNQALEESMEEVEHYRQLSAMLSEFEELAGERALKLKETEGKLAELEQKDKEREAFISYQSAITADESKTVEARGSALAEVAREARLEVHRLLAKAELNHSSYSPPIVSEEANQRLQRQVEELTEAKAKVEAQRKELQVGARELCDKVSVMSDKYRAVTAELELSQRQVAKLVAKYNRLKQEVKN